MVTGVGAVTQPTPTGVITSTKMGSNSVITGGPVGTVESSVPPRRSSDNRRSNKPIMEKRRRARINNCLNELKTLILDAMKKDPARHSKLEKADILEMTVKHLENLQRQQAAMTAAADPNIVNKFRAGFSECAGEVGRFPGLEPTIKRRLLQHLANCLSVGTPNANIKTEPVAPTTQAVQVHILPTPAASVDGHVPVIQHNGIFFTNGNGTGVQLVPTRLPNGDIALVLPTTATTQQNATVFRTQQQHHQQQQQNQQHSPTSSTSPLPSTTSPLPMLVPIPTRTASTASAASSTSSSSASSMTGYSNGAVSGRECPLSPATKCFSVPDSPHSYEYMDTSQPPAPAYSPPLQKPLSLVIKKRCEVQQPVEEDKPWRPW